MVTKRESPKILFGVGCVDGDDKEVIELFGEHATLSIGIAELIAGHAMLGHRVVGEIRGDLQWFSLGEDGVPE